MLRKFIEKVLLAGILLPAVYAGVYFIVALVINLNKHQASIFIWGDSQTYYGLEVKALSDSLREPVLSAARQGAGVYDFLTFANAVPGNSIVLLGISDFLFLRSKNLDRNDGGISVAALGKLSNHGYSIPELFHIIQRSRRPTNKFRRSNTMHLGVSEEKIESFKPYFKEIYDQIPAYYHDKQNLYLEGIKQLQEKGCQIILIKFPIHGDLKKIRKKSSIAQQSAIYMQRICSLFEESKREYMYIDKPNPMYHLTHLNSLGTEVVTKKMIPKIMEIKKENGTTAKRSKLLVVTIDLTSNTVD